MEPIHNLNWTPRFNCPAKLDISPPKHNSNWFLQRHVGLHFAWLLHSEECCRRNWFFDNAAQNQSNRFRERWRQFRNVNSSLYPFRLEATNLQVLKRPFWFNSPPQPRRSIQLLALSCTINRERFKQSRCKLVKTRWWTWTALWIACRTCTNCHAQIRHSKSLWEA